MDIGAILERYLQRYPDDKDRLALLCRQVEQGDVMNDRKQLPGHITGAAIILSPDRMKVLLIHHAFLGRWMQPGGHWDQTDVDVLEAARREAVEETSVRIADYIPSMPDSPLVPVHIDTHHIPANAKKGEPEHYHHDFRYVFVAASEDLQHEEREVLQAGWFNLDAPEAAELHEVLERTKRLIAKA